MCQVAFWCDCPPAKMVTQRSSLFLYCLTDILNTWPPGFLENGHMHTMDSLARFMNRPRNGTYYFCSHPYWPKHNQITTTQLQVFLYAQKGIHETEFGKHTQVGILCIWSTECNILKKHASQISGCIWWVRHGMKGTDSKTYGRREKWQPWLVCV